MARWLLGAAALLYAALVAVLAVLWSVSPQITWWIAVSNVVAPWFFAPLPPLLLLAALLRSRRAALALAVPAVLFVALFGDRFVPRQVEAAQPQLRVVSMNVFRDNEEIDAAVAEILAQGADVVALQEVTSDTRAYFEIALAAQYPYQDFDGDFGFISKLPLTSSGPLYESRGRWATVDVGGQTIALVNVHLHRRQIATRQLPGLSWLPIPRGFDTSSQQRQVQELLLELKKAQLPYILVGDFNLGDRDPAYAALAAELRDAYRSTSAGFGFTYPGKRRVGPIDIPFPLIRIDYIWSTPEITPVRTQVNCSGGSDHCMVIADLAVSADQR